MNYDKNSFIELFIGFGEYLKTYQLDSLETETLDDKYLTQNEVLKLYPLFTSESTLYNATRYKGLPYIKNGRHRYYQKTEIDNWIKKNTIIKANEGIVIS